jgi:hypothetical protein
MRELTARFGTGRARGTRWQEKAAKHLYIAYRLRGMLWVIGGEIQPTT